MLKDILSWLCGEEIQEPQHSIIELSIENIGDFAQTVAIKNKPEEKFILIETGEKGDLKRAVFFKAILENISANEKEALIKEIASNLQPGTEIILHAKEDLDLFIKNGFSVEDFETLPILKRREK